MSKRKAVSKRIRFGIFARDNFTCCYCGEQPPTVVLEIEHLVPVSKGGDNNESNLKTACANCNRGKGANTIGEAVPTENARLIQAQELAEAQRHLRELAERVEVERKFRQMVVNRICEIVGVESVRKATATAIVNLIQEFGSIAVDEWMILAAGRTSGETRFVKYLFGIARNKRREGKQ